MGDLCETPVELVCPVCKTSFSVKLVLYPTRVTCPKGHNMGNWRLDPKNLRGVQVSTP